MCNQLHAVNWLNRIVVEMLYIIIWFALFRQLNVYIDSDDLLVRTANFQFNLHTAPKVRFVLFL